MPSGGPRQGNPGKVYSNRSDLNENKQPIQAAPAAIYGDRKASEDAQRAVPLPAAPQGPAPGELPTLDAPSARPSEPVTMGLQAPGVVADTDRLLTIEVMRALYRQFPTEGLGRLIARMERP
jgi:hypothetical protein